MKGFYKNLNISLLNFNNSLFSTLNIDFIKKNYLLYFPIIKIESQIKFFFHPNYYSFDSGELNSFFDHVLQIRSLFNIFGNSHSNFSYLYFSKLKKSSFKFRKRKNTYFSLIYRLQPNNNFKFFQSFPSFLIFFKLLSKRIRVMHSLHLVILRISCKNNILSFFFYNPNHFESYCHNKKIQKKNFIMKLSINIPQKSKLFIFSLFKKIYPRIFKQF